MRANEKLRAALKRSLCFRRWSGDLRASCGQQFLLANVASQRRAPTLFSRHTRRAQHFVLLVNDEREKLRLFSSARTALVIVVKRQHKFQRYDERRARNTRRSTFAVGRADRWRAQPRFDKRGVLVVHSLQAKQRESSGCRRKCSRHLDGARRRA